MTDTARSPRLTARQAAALIAPTAVEVELPAPRRNPLGWPGYDDARDDATAASGSDESVVVMRGSVPGRSRDGGAPAPEAVIVAWEFSHLGGSMGEVAGSRICEAYDLARTDGLPIVLMPATGGARMQEGMVSLVQMARTTAAARAHADAGLLQVAILRHPSTGGVFASHANLADVILAEPGATIGFAGPRVAATLTGQPLPEASHTAHGAAAAGLVDAVVPPDQWGEVVGEFIRWPVDRDAQTSAPTAPVPTSDPATAEGIDAWAAVVASRADDRPRASEYLDAIEVNFEIHGDRAGSDDRSLRVALGSVDGTPVVVIAIDRDVNHGALGPGGYRKAWRGLRLAERLGIPVVTLVDTAGADATASSEAGGIANHIARTFDELLLVSVPTVALVTGEGGSGGALALAVADRLLMLEHSTFSVIAPEGAAAILHRDPMRAVEVAGLLKPTAATLVELGIADELVPELPDPVTAGWAAVGRALTSLADMPRDTRVPARLDRWRHVAEGTA